MVTASFNALVLKKMTQTLTHVNSSEASTFLVVNNASCVNREGNISLVNEPSYKQISLDKEISVYCQKKKHLHDNSDDQESQLQPG
jgi:hypothetical protein